MNDEYDEYEEVYEEETEETSQNTGLPAGVIERLSAYAERTKKELASVKQEFYDYIAKEYLCEDASNEDEDLLEDWAEQMLVETRNVSSGGSSGAYAGVPFVGMFVGVEPNSRDRRGGLVKRAKRDFTLDAGAAVGSGFVGHFTKGDGVWMLNTSNGEKRTEFSVDEIPDHSFLADGERICLLTKQGRAKAMSMIGRNYFFLGAPESEFTNDNAIQLWRLDCQGEDANMVVRIGEPCRIEAKLPSDNAPEGFKDVLSTNLGIKDNITYTDEFVSESVRPLLNPMKMWVDSELHGYYTPLEDLVEAFESGSRSFTINGEQGKSGPVIFTKGTVNRLSSEARESEYDEGNRSYSLSLSSSALQSMHSQQDLREVMCWVGSACNDLTNPFVAFENGEEIPYAENSTVLVCGRIAVKRKDGVDIPNLKVMGVFAHPRRIRRRATGGDTGRGQFE
jgi:hypothetical protein